ncbi:acyl-CoA Delta(11) desaturase-like [Frankliniella occidentalis]|uniref:Acyl-CoA Delta(11) desaturase-like n=1 Tax=Frankliniella occidentalis TaxID=133901 RepID=A0A9C6U5E6_FRAOC|nr:acyl-CoA Delta(11) desaturase-like [Frankliniella occidentalis]XP_052126579.1 acyl-CoA Delta(11) desaturase-like [Frankliniella occidentalis]XP_052126580.1 acyl-CoA Delta(11) desaturase-like [Frankliniella occidentalis]
MMSGKTLKSRATAETAAKSNTRKPQELAWYAIVIIGGFHITAAWVLLTTRFSLPMWAYVYVYGSLTLFGTTAGAHRLWTHRTYKAKFPLRVLLTFLHVSSAQTSVLQWVRDHRAHHKYVDTDADPHNSKRGFFYCHIGWTMMHRHPEVKRQGAKIDFSDVLADSVVQFEHRFHYLFVLLCAFIIPTVIPVVAWDETWTVSSLASIVRVVVFINITMTVNSFAHMFGDRPYNKQICPTELWMVSFLAMGEGWHNYHHTFPWDYKTSELPYYCNFTTFALDGFAKVGWAYDFKSASKELVDSVASQHGDGSRSTAMGRPIMIHEFGLAT